MQVPITLVTFFKTWLVALLLSAFVAKQQKAVSRINVSDSELSNTILCIFSGLLYAPQGMPH